MFAFLFLPRCPPHGLLHSRMAGDSLFPTLTFPGTSQAGGPRAAAMVFQLARQAVGLRRGAANVGNLLSAATEVHTLTHAAPAPLLSVCLPRVPAFAALLIEDRHMTGKVTRPATLLPLLPQVCLPVGDTYHWNGMKLDPKYAVACSCKRPVRAAALSTLRARECAQRAASARAKQSL